MATDLLPLADEAPATHLETRLALLERSPRGYVVIRHTFVQKPFSRKRPRAPRGSTLASLVTEHQERALDAFLLLLALEPALVEDQPIEAAIWARALSDGPMSPAAVSRVWLQLERHALIDRTRRKGHAFVRPRREDGRGPYTRPGRILDEDGGKLSRRDQYFTLPHQYWEDKLDQELSLPAKALLLIALHNTSTKPSFYLPYDYAPAWYGISPETAARGLAELRQRGVLNEYRQLVRAPLSPTGQTTRIHYLPVAPYSTEARRRAQRATANVVRKKAGGKARAPKVTRQREPEGS